MARERKFCPNCLTDEKAACLSRLGRRLRVDMNEITEELLKIVSNYTGCISEAHLTFGKMGNAPDRQSTEHISIESKADLPGLEIHIHARYQRRNGVYSCLCYTWRTSMIWYITIFLLEKMRMSSL